MGINNIITLGAVCVALASLIVSILLYCKNVRHDRRKDTLDAYNTLQCEALDALCVSYTDESVRQITANGDTDEESHEAFYTLTTLLARIEHFCVGVNSKIYDWETVFELSHGFLDTTIADRLEPMWNEKQKNPNFDPYENSKRVIDKLKTEAERRKITKRFMD